MRLYAFLPFIFVIMFAAGLLETGFKVGQENPTAKSVFVAPAKPAAPAHDVKKLDK